MATNPCVGEFVFGLIVGAGLFAFGQALAISWWNRVPKVPAPAAYHTICTNCTVRGSGAGRP